MFILGLNAYHGDAAACLVRDGVLVAAAEEERFRRVKHWAEFPTEAIRYCLRQGGVGLGEVAQVALNQDARANLWRKLGFVVTRRPDLSLILDRIRNKREREGGAETLARELGAPFRGEVQYVEHHLVHLASAFLVSPFDEVVAVSVDGFGDFASAGWGVARVADESLLIQEAVKDEPVVCRPEEALDCFLRTKIDVLVMGGWFLSRDQS